MAWRRHRWCLKCLRVLKTLWCYLAKTILVLNFFSKIYFLNSWRILLKEICWLRNLFGIYSKFKYDTVCLSYIEKKNWGKTIDSDFFKADVFSNRLSCSAHRTPNFTNFKFLFVYFLSILFQIKVLNHIKMNPKMPI